MLTRFKLYLRMLVLGYLNNGSKSTCCHASSKNGSLLVGLQSLVQLSSSPLSEGKQCNPVLKSSLRTSTTTLLPPRNKFESGYLKTCSLCNMKLSLDKDIYMYRGDQGFCSLECRNRQIFLDEMKEAESSTAHMLINSYNHCKSSADKCEIRLLREERRRRQGPQPDQRHSPLLS